MGTHPIFESDFDCLTEFKMDTKQEYWSKRWDDGKIGWHKSEFNKHLVEYTNENWKSNDKMTVFVPLCGKTKDLIWLSQQGCQVVGIEFCQQAVTEFFADNNIKYDVEKMDDYEIYSGEGGFKIYRGCFFKTPIIEKFDFIYDRASLVAIDSELRTVSKYRISNKFLRCFLYKGRNIFSNTLRK